MIRSILLILLSLGIVGTGYWGYKEHQEKNAVLIHAENTYQRSFHELVYHMDLLHDKIGTSLAMNSKSRLSPQLVDIWRISSEALANVGQLPLTLLPFNKTEEFLSNIGDFTYRTAVRDLDKEPLSKEEMTTLKKLYEQASEIKDELRNVQHAVLENDLRWMDVELALATNGDPLDNTIIDGFKTVEKKVEGYSESSSDSPLVTDTGKGQLLKHLHGKKVTENEALQFGKKLFNVKSKSDIQLTKSGEGSDIPLYTLSYEEGEKRGYLDMSVNGAHPISLLVDRPLNKKQLSLNEGFERAKEFLSQNEFENMTLQQSTEYDQIGVYTFLYQQDKVKVYPDTVEVKVALDNGDILGLTAKNYYMNHKERKIESPILSIAEAKKKVNPQVQIMDDSLAIIRNDLGDEVLTYEFIGTYEDDSYRIYINAMDGTEEKIERLQKAERNFSYGT
ncbi:spore germination protein [Cerasibacillus quisquiliarum]|uniref:Germination protein YpeB n=1 Tax=Cerasibacillus quisquiliarum TaxID=227865 RepID=A0A511UZ12_9BACI|nr:germination protein YpeB [Cerasibacillus quisquiliarum]MBB5145393.1 spore germination protein [Cerasibacillus quisquiliarum]GEN31829.1 germination protein YpeB [Cerasibacillus quisquiliarum]